MPRKVFEQELARLNVDLAETGRRAGDGAGLTVGAFHWTRAPAKAIISLGRNPALGWGESAEARVFL